MWLSTEADPGAAPNTGFYFNPAYYMYANSGSGPVAETYSMVVVYELHV